MWHSREIPDAWGWAGVSRTCTVWLCHPHLVRVRDRVNSRKGEADAAVGSRATGRYCCCLWGIVCDLTPNNADAVK
jgi:hypothetical protein